MIKKRANRHHQCWTAQNKIDLNQINIENLSQDAGQPRARSQPAPAVSTPSKPCLLRRRCERIGVSHSFSRAGTFCRCLTAYAGRDTSTTDWPQLLDLIRKGPTSPSGSRLKSTGKQRLPRQQPGAVSCRKRVNTSSCASGEISAQGARMEPAVQTQPCGVDISAVDRLHHAH